MDVVDETKTINKTFFLLCPFLFLKTHFKASKGNEKSNTFGVISAMLTSSIL